MKYSKIGNCLHNEITQTFKFKTKNWVKINHDARGTCNTNNQIKFKTTMFKSSLCVIVMHK